MVIIYYFLSENCKPNTVRMELGGTINWLSTVDILLFLYFSSCNIKVHPATF